MKIDLVVAPDPDRAIRWLAERFLALVADAATNRSRPFSVSLAGGSTPRRLYELLASPLWRTRLDWSGVAVYLGDERYVDPNDPRANYRMARETLLDIVLVSPHHVHPVPTASGDPAADAAAYAATLSATLTERDGVPRLNLALLGLGPDGHTAGLFPGSGILDSKAFVAAAVPPDAPTPRITLTPRVLNAADEVVVFCTGNLKAGALAGLLAAKGSADEVPARVLNPVSGRLTVVCDLEACEQLDIGPLRDGITTLRI